MTPTTPAAAWMDRLSDRIGALVPGCARLPPRHPVKVCLMMLSLSVISGWTVGAAALITHQFYPFTNVPVFIASGLSFGTLVVIPLLLWMNQRSRIIIAAGVYVLIASFAYIPLFVFTFEHLRGFIPHGMVAGFMHSLEGAAFALFWGGGVLILLRRFSILWLILFLVLSTASTWGINSLLPNSFSGSKLWVYFMSNLYFMSQFMVQHICAAICIGMLMWDRTPRPKFAPSETAALTNSEA